jgi:isopenicillin N synthase-like dioxygenase
VQKVVQGARVPRLDLRDAGSTVVGRRVQFQQELRGALTEFGFVRIVGHQIDNAQINRVYEGFERFFAAGNQAKSECASAAGGQRGFTAFGVEHAKNQREPDLKEFYHVGRELPTTHPLHDRYPPNIWPVELPELRDASLALYAALDACACTLLESLALGFALAKETFSAMLRDGNSILRALHYPPIPLPQRTPDADATPGQALRAAPHEDINLITLLSAATDPGLEILTLDGRWIAIPACAEEIIVDAGDMLSRVTNDVIPAATHRVVTPDSVRGRHRYAIPYFAHPYPDCDLSVLPAFVGPERPAKYPPTTAAAFLEERLKEIGLIPAPDPHAP